MISLSIPHLDRQTLVVLAWSVSVCGLSVWKYVVQQG